MARGGYARRRPRLCSELQRQYVSVIDTATNTVTALPVPVGVNPTGVAVTPDGAHVYVGNFSSNTVSVIDTATNAVTATVMVGLNPEGIAVTPDGAHVYVGNFFG